MIYAVNKHTKEHRIIQRGAMMPVGTWWETRVADADGWIPWDGGECPLPNKCIAEVEFRDGDCKKGIAGKWDVCWFDDGNVKDIIAYRPIPTEEDIAVKKMVRIIEDWASDKAKARALYRVGYRRIEEEVKK